MKKDAYNAKIKDIADKIPNMTNLGTTAAFNAKINEVKGEITSMTTLATNSALCAKKMRLKPNKIPNVSDLVKKTDYDAEMKDIKDKDFST